MFDIDRFKDINDNHGHACGDLVICKVAKTLQASFRAADIVARIGGDEFIVMTSNMDKAQCRGQFEKILKKVAGLIIVDDGQTIPVTVSIGVTTILTETLDAMVRQADELLYQAKGSGRNCVAID
jgi:diguanylate cyclase (GGDEF)-like protein